MSLRDTAISKWRFALLALSQCANAAVLFAPELEVFKHQQSELAVPLPIGPIVQGHAFWFRRKSHKA